MLRVSFLSSLPSGSPLSNQQQHHQQINPHFSAEETSETIVRLKNLILQSQEETEGFTPAL